MLTFYLIVSDLFLIFFALLYKWRRNNTHAFFRGVVSVLFVIGWYCILMQFGFKFNG